MTDQEFNQTEVGLLFRDVENKHDRAVRLDVEALYDERCRISPRLLKATWEDYYEARRKLLDRLKGVTFPWHRVNAND